MLLRPYRYVAWFLFVLSIFWAAVPIAVSIVIDSEPPTLYTLSGAQRGVAGLCILVYLAVGGGLWYGSRLAWAPQHRWAPLAVWVFGGLPGLLMGLASGSVFVWLNGQESRAVFARSTLVLSYATSYRTARGGPGYAPHAFIPERTNPFISNDVPASLSQETRIQHLCVQEHVGRFGWPWFDHFEDCNAPLEHFATRDMAPEWLSEAELIAEAGDSTHFPVPLQAFRTHVTTYTAVEQPPGSGHVVAVPVPQVVDPIWTGLDVDALAQTLPLPPDFKHDMHALALSTDQQRVLFVCDAWLFLHDRAQGTWTWLRTDPSEMPFELFLFSKARSRWAFDPKADMLYQIEPEHALFRRWRMAAPVAAGS